MPAQNEDQVLAYFKTHKQDFHEKYGVYKIGIFGSFVRHEQTEASDIDIAIEMVPGKKKSPQFPGI